MSGESWFPREAVGECVGNAKFHSRQTVLWPVADLVPVLNALRIPLIVIRIFQEGNRFLKTIVCNRPFQLTRKPVVLREEAFQASLRLEVMPQWPQSPWPACRRLARPHAHSLFRIR